MKIRSIVLIGILFLSMSFMIAEAIAGERNIYQLKVYTIENEAQEEMLDDFLENAYLPALHRAGIDHVGVFKPLTGSEDADKKVYVLVPFADIVQFEGIEQVLAADSKYQKDGSGYIMAAHDNPPYKRIESVLMRAFVSMPEYGVPEHGTAADERIYELRSYQAATEERYEKKVDMFDDGEAKLFMDLGFQPVFFGEVISGGDMPNLIYMTTHANKAAQDKNWDAFRTSPVWDTMKNDPQYANTVSHIDKYLLYPTDYSDL